jgi:hypothetical protein
MQIPFIIDDTLSAMVLMKIESALLGITLATLTLFDVLIATESAPIRCCSIPSVIIKIQPF